MTSKKVLLKDRKIKGQDTVSSDEFLADLRAAAESVEDWEAGKTELRVTTLETQKAGEGVKVRRDKETGALYIRWSASPIANSDEVEPGIILDYDKNARVVGVEILSVTS